MEYWIGGVVIALLVAAWWLARRAWSPLPLEPMSDDWRRSKHLYRLDHH